jgi:hypothetical protein
MTANRFVEALRVDVGRHATATPLCLSGGDRIADKQATEKGDKATNRGAS